MKKKIILGFAALSILAFVGCKKKDQSALDKPKQNENSSLKSQIIRNYVYLRNNIIIQESQIDLENDNTTLVFDENSSNVYVFDNNQKVLQWANAQNTDFSNSVKTSLNILVLLQNYIVANNIESYYEQTGSTPKDYDAFFEGLFGTGGKSVINILHENPNASVSGSILAPVSYPKLSAVNFNYRTCAVSIAVSALRLCKNNWYISNKVFFGALAGVYQSICFNNVTSSVSQNLILCN